MSAATATQPGRRVYLSWTLSRYLGRHVVIGIGVMVFGFSTLAYLIDSIELLRRGDGSAEFSFGVALIMSALHLPFIIQKILPFTLLFGAMAGFHRLTRSNELVAARAAGVSVWQFITPAIALAFIGGIVSVTVFSPLASAMFGRYQQFDERYFNAENDIFAVSAGGLWLRQLDGDRQLVIHATESHPDPFTLNNVSIYVTAANQHYEARIDAPSARLDDGAWLLDKAVTTNRDGSVTKDALLRIPTKLAPDRIQDSFKAPETMSFWELPGYIKLMEAVGFASRRHVLFYQGLLATPLTYCAMLFIGTVFSLRLVRLGGTSLFIVAGLLAGFTFYILSDVVFAMGLSGRLPVVMAAWGPAVIGILCGLAMLFHLEDG